MKEFLKSLGKSSTTSIIALLVVIGFITISILTLFHKPADVNLAILIIGNLASITSVVATYYFMKKENTKEDKK